MFSLRYKLILYNLINLSLKRELIIRKTQFYILKAGITTRLAEQSILRFVRFTPENGIPAVSSHESGFVNKIPKLSKYSSSSTCSGDH